MHSVQAFGRNRCGGVVLIFGLMAPVLFGMVGASVEYASLSNRRSKLQTAVDAGALAAARELTLTNVTDTHIEAVAQQVALASLNGSSSRGGGEAAVSAQILGDKRSVQVGAREPIVGVLGRLVMLPMTELSVDAIASVSGRLNVCLIGLDDQQKGTVHMEKNAQLTAPGCAVFSNSKDPKGLQGQDNAVLTAAFICSAGGYDGKGSQFTPAPVTDCPVPADPLASRQRPSVGGCTWVDREIKFSQIIFPGTYCGGLKIASGVSVVLSAGIYVMDNGPLVADGTSSITGQDVGFYFTGSKGGLSFDSDTTISLTAPKYGIMAGLLFFEDRSVSAPVPPPTNKKGRVPDAPYGSPPMRDYRISSNDARMLLGTIYLPAGRLIIDADKPVSDRSAYTVIVARRIDLFDGPNLILNTDYGATDIPVPEGVGLVGGQIMLTR